jgi:hypothetical protein
MIYHALFLHLGSFIICLNTWLVINCNKNIEQYKKELQWRIKPPDYKKNHLSEKERWHNSLCVIPHLPGNYKIVVCRNWHLPLKFRWLPRLHRAGPSASLDELRVHLLHPERFSDKKCTIFKKILSNQIIFSDEEDWNCETCADTHSNKLDRNPHIIVRQDTFTSDPNYYINVATRTRL